MPKATNKSEFVKAADDNWGKMWGLIDLLTEQQQEQNFTYDLDKMDDARHWKRDKNLRDVLTHFEWQQLLLNWVASNTKGEDKPFLPPQYHWGNYQKMNDALFDKHQHTRGCSSRAVKFACKPSGESDHPKRKADGKNGAVFSGSL